MGTRLRLLQCLWLLVAGALTTGAASVYHNSSNEQRVAQLARAPSREQLLAASQLAQAFASTWNGRDGTGYGEAYWPEAELVDPSGQVWNGRNAIIQTHLDLWAGAAKATHMTAQVRRVRALSASLFVVDIDTAATGFSPPPPGAPDGIVRTRLKHVVEKRMGQWKIFTSQNTFISQR